MIPYYVKIENGWEHVCGHHITDRSCSILIEKHESEPTDNDAVGGICYNFTVYDEKENTVSFPDNIMCLRDLENYLHMKYGFHKFEIVNANPNSKLYI